MDATGYPKYRDHYFSRLLLLRIIKGGTGEKRTSVAGIVAALDLQLNARVLMIEMGPTRFDWKQHDSKCLRR